MGAPWYTPGGVPGNKASGSSSDMRGELVLVETALDKLPGFSGNGLKLCRINTGETAMEAFTFTGLDTANSPVANDFARFTDSDTLEGRSYAEVKADLDLEIGTDVQAFDTDTAKTDVAQEFTKSQNFNQTALTSSVNAVAWNVADNQSAQHTLTENTTIAAPSNLKAGMFITLNVVQHASSAKTLAWNAVFKGTIPTMSTDTGKQVLYTYYSPDGTNCHYCGGTEAI